MKKTNNEDSYNCISCNQSYYQINKNIIFCTWTCKLINLFKKRKHGK